MVFTSSIPQVASLSHVPSKERILEFFSFSGALLER